VLAAGEDEVAAEARMRDLMTQLGVHELDQTKLEQMFAHYNQNWSDYYGSSRTFDMSTGGDIVRYGFGEE
jgi:hypothetical protein